MFLENMFRERPVCQLVVRALFRAMRALHHQLRKCLLTRAFHVVLHMPLDFRPSYTVRERVAAQFAALAK